MAGQNQVKVTKDRSSSVNFQKVCFLAPMHRKGILDIMAGQNLVKATKGHQVQIFKVYF